MTDMAVSSPNRPAFLPPRKTFLDLVFSSDTYAASLRTRTPKRLTTIPVDALAGDSARADAYFQGHFEFMGLDAKLANLEPWFVKDMPLHWHMELHQFNWIRDFSANGTDAAKRHARTLITSWIKHFDTYQTHIWDPEILARRIINWTRQSDFLLTSNDGDFNYKFLKSLRQQFQHLMRYCKYIARKDDQFDLYLALYLSALAFPDTKAQKVKLEVKLLEQIDNTILADGCHYSRNPSRHLTMLADMVGLKQTYIKLQEEVPSQLLGGIDRLAPVVRFFRHGDGSLALFNGALINDETECDQLLAIADAPGRPPHRCPQGGFERLKSGKALLLLETGEGGRQKNPIGHAGIGSFEFSFARERIFVNCGAHPDAVSHWGKALASTAAHTALSIGDTNTAFPLPNKATEEDPVKVNCHVDEGNIWLDFTNPGYASSLNVSHTRRLYLDASGENLRGEDQVSVGDLSHAPMDFTLRFHLHPSLSLSKSMSGRHLLIRSKSGSGWQFMSSLAEISLEESIYCGHVGEQRKSQQIVLRGRLNGNDSLSVKWALTLLGDEKS